MQDEKRPILPSRRLVVLAAIAGTIAGALAVYMKEAGPGNTETGVVAENCAPALARAAALKPFAKGDVAAFVPQTAPMTVALSFTGPDGKPGTLATLPPKTRLVNLWATWCVPCREEMPALDRLQQAALDPGFEVLTVNIDSGTDEKPKAFLAETGIKALPLHHDATMGSFSELKTKGIAFGLPVTLLVDAKGCVMGAMNGPAAWDGADAAALVKAAL